MFGQGVACHFVRWRENGDGVCVIPYYSDDSCEIYHDDCRVVLPTFEASGSLIVTDPPYGNGTEYEDYEDSPDGLDALVEDVWPLLVPYRVTALTPGVANLHRWPAPKWTLCWFHPAGNGSGPWGFCTWQPVLVYGPDPFLAASLGRRPDGIQHMPNSARDAWIEHPCPKPVALMRWIIERVSISTDDVIIDPFMGSGTTLRAAKDLGRKAVGIELSERYCEIAANRLAQEVLAL